MRVARTRRNAEVAEESPAHQMRRPSSGIAQRETEALGPLLRRIREEAGCALLVIEHDMPLITSLSDSIVALDLETDPIRSG